MAIKINSFVEFNIDTKMSTILIYGEMTISQGEQMVVVMELHHINILSFEGETLVLDGHETFVFH